MRFEMRKLSIGVTPGSAIHIDDATGVTIRVVRGRVWVTQEGCVDDLFLDAGAGHTFRRPGRVVVSAEKATGVDAAIVFDAPLSVVGRETFWHQVRRLLTIAPAPLSIAANAYEGL